MKLQRFSFKSKKIFIFHLILLHRLWIINAFNLSQGFCKKNISVKYQIPITKTRSIDRDQNKQIVANSNANANALSTEQYVDYEQHIRWDTVNICCPGYRTVLFGLCQPICSISCPVNSYCAEPNKCVCKHGYEPSSYHMKNQLICRPTCHNGCPEHSYCVGHNQCKCRLGYRDSSSWFTPLRCERIHCAVDQIYDISRKACVKIEMPATMEELMRRIANRLSKGLDKLPNDVDYDYDADLTNIDGV